MEEAEEKSRRLGTSILERPTSSTVVLYGHDSNAGQESHSHHDDTIEHSDHHRVGSSTVRNIEIDWREVDPYFSELSDCASFWTLINFTCDVIYSGLFVLFFIMGQDVESMFFEGLLNHINPILIYLILSLIINYGALRSLRCGREKCFLVFSITKALLFPITVSLLLYLVFWDVQDYFGTFWISFVVIVSCYNLTAALGLWSMFSCNKYILVNELEQTRLRKAKQQRQARNEEESRYGCANITPAPSASLNHYNNQCGSTSRTCSSHLRKIGDSNCANNIILVCKPDNNSSMNSNFLKSVKSHGCKLDTTSSHSSKTVGRSYIDGSHTSCRLKAKRNSGEDDALSFAEEDEVLQISTVHKVMQEIRLLDTTNKRSLNHEDSDDGDSL